MAFENNPIASAVITTDEPVTREFSEDFEGSFVIGPGGWEPWQTSAVASGASFHSGTRSLKLSTTNSEVYVDLHRPELYDAEVEIKFWIKAPVGTVLPLWYMDIDLAAGSPSEVTMTGNWQEITVIGTSYSEWLALWVYSVTAPPTFDVFIDDFSITASSTASTAVLTEGDLTLDSSRYPYAEASVEVPFTSDDLLEQIKPGQRVTLDATSEGTHNPIYSPWVERVRNLALNPSFESVAATFEVRRNLTTNPRLRTSTGWSIVPQGTVTANGIQFDITSQLGRGSNLLYQTGAIATTAGVMRSSSIEVEVPAGYPEVELQLITYDYSAPTGNMGEATVTVLPGTTVTIAAPSTRGANGTLGVRTILRAGPTTFLPVGARFIVRNALVEAVATPGPYFDGTTSPDPDFTPAWAGTANASESILNGKRPYGVNTARSQVDIYQSAEWSASGNFSLKVAPNGAGNSSYGSVVITGLTANTTYTALMKIRVDEPQTGALHSAYLRNIMAQSTGMVPNNVLSPSVPNEPGVHETRVTFTLGSATSLTLFVMNGSTSTPLWFDDLALVEGTYTGPYIDGNMTSSALTQYRWLGTPELSTSVKETRTLQWVQWIPEPGITADLVLRKREVSHDGKTITLDLASDEALLDTWADIVDDSTPRTHEANLRNLINYVLNKAIPGAALQPGTANADVTAQWDATNILKNPDGESSTANWTSGSSSTTIALNAGAGMDGVAGFIRATQTGTSGAVFLASTTYDLSAREGQMFTASVYARHSTTGATASLTLRFLDQNNATLRNVVSTVQALPTAWGTRYSVTGVAPANTAKVIPYMSIFGTASGRTWDLDQAMLTEGPVLLPWFDGNSTDTSNYVYAWEDTPNASPSTRVASPERLPELFTWDAGTTAWAFLEPLVASAGFRLFCDEQRRWWLIDPSNWTVPGRFSARPDNTVEGTDTMDAADDESGYTGVVAVFKWTAPDGTTRTEKDAAGTAGKVKVLEFDSPYPGPGLAAAHLAKVQGLGRVQDVTTKTDYNVRPGQEVQIDLPGTYAQLGTLQSVKWELTTGLMSIGSAGLRETPPGSIDLLTGTIDSLTGTIDSL